ncbi:hypothetical protein FACS1894182_00610 [Bacteroidia bacterium]|nr:hypothetical protein FACS1894182_00610 [Bacteroidia bacterium]
MIGIAVYKLHQPEEVAEKEIVPENPKVEQIEEDKSKPTKQITNTDSVKKNTSNLDVFISEEPMDDLPEEMNEHTPEAIVIEETSVEKKELTAIYIPLTKSLFFASDASIDVLKRRVKQSERSFSGKIYYQGENGLIESFLTIDEEGVMHEILASYDPNGNAVDHVEIGLLIPGNPEKKYATLSVNKLSVYQLTMVKSSNKKQERVTEYSINPQLYFKKGKTFTKLL